MARRPVQLSDLRRIEVLSDPQFSPCGEQILFAKKRIGEKNRAEVNLFVVPAAGGAMRALTRGKDGNGHGRWSPGGQQIAFLSGREEGLGQIFLLYLAGGDPEPLTKLEEGRIAGFKWSPDGAHIAFLYRPTEAAHTKAEAKRRTEAGESDAPWATDHYWYRLDGDGYFGSARYALYVVEVATGKTRMIFDDDPLGQIDFDWLPGGQELVVSASRCARPLFDPADDRLFRVTLSGKAKEIPGLPRASRGDLSVSPDGQWVASLGRQNPEGGWGTENSQVLLAPLAGGSERVLTADFDCCLTGSTLSDTEADGPSALAWSPDGAALYVKVPMHGEVQVARVDVAKATVKVLTKGEHVLGLGSLDTEGKRMAITLGDPVRPAEVGVVELKSGKITTLTNVHEALLKEVEIKAPSTHWVPSTDGVKVQTWVIRGREKVSPAVIEIHGGPHTQYGCAFFFEFQLLAAQGYTVVYSNPRGSKGYSEAFCAAIRNDWGNKDWDDLQAVTKFIQSDPLADATRIGVMGGSYGGYLTNWAVGHASDYCAAITDRCVSNWVSAAGNSDVPLNRDDYFGGRFYAGYAQLEKLWQQSPIAYFDQVKTPMLVIHSEGDLRCNIEQGEQVFMALQAQGVPSRFVRYPRNTSHGMSRNGPIDMREHRLTEIVTWWGHYLQKAGKSKKSADKKAKEVAKPPKKASKAAKSGKRATAG